MSLNPLPCPLREEDVIELPITERLQIEAQNKMFAFMNHNRWYEITSKEATDYPNEDAFAYMFKFRRDYLLEVIGSKDKYSWRKQDIAQRELALMGYDSSDPVKNPSLIGEIASVQ